MCGRYVSPDTAAIERQWQIGRRNSNPFPRRFNAAPSTDVPLLWREGATLVLGVARWGLIPQWWKEAKPPRFSHNARIVHPRMPLALSPDAESAWLESGAVAADTDTIEHYAVRRLVNSAAAEGPELIEPMAA